MKFKLLLWTLVLIVMSSFVLGSPASLDAKLKDIWLLNDTSGVGLFGTDTLSVTGTPDCSSGGGVSGTGQCYFLDSTEYFAHANDYKTDYPSGTICMWVMYPAENQDYFYRKTYSGGSSFLFIRRTTEDGIRMQIDSVSGSSEPVAPDNTAVVSEYRLFCGSWNSTHDTAYGDGLKDAGSSAVTQGTPSSNTATDYFIGKVSMNISNYMFFNISLTDAEVLELNGTHFNPVLKTFASASNNNPEINWYNNNYTNINNTLLNSTKLSIFVNVSDSDGDLVNITFMDNGTNLINVNLFNSSTGLYILNLTTEKHYLLNASVIDQSGGYAQDDRILDVIIDTTTPSVTINNLKSIYYIGEIAYYNTTCSDNNLYGCNISLLKTYQRNFSETPNINTTSFIINQKYYLNESGGYEIYSYASDDHTLNTIPNYKETKYNGKVIFNDYVTIEVISAETKLVPPTTTKSSDRYTFDFVLPTTTDHLYRITSPLGLKLRPLSYYKGHIIVGEGLGKYWIDFQNSINEPVTIVSSTPTEIVLRTKASSFSSIGGVNIGYATSNFIVKDVNATIQTQTGLSINGVCIDLGVGIDNVTINDTNFINIGNNTNWNFINNTAYNITTSFSILITCNNTEGFIGTDTLSFTYTPPSIPINVSYNSTLVTGVCPNSLESISVMGLFLIIGLVFVAFGFVFKVPFLIMCGGSILVFSYYQLGKCATLLAIPIPLAGIILVVYSVVHRFR